VNILKLAFEHRGYVVVASRSPVFQLRAIEASGAGAAEEAKTTADQTVRSVKR
jgi:hypothetical protein